MKEKKDLNFPLCQKSPWEDNENSIWIASVLRLNRNVDKYKFPSKLTTEGQKQILSIIAKPLLACESLQNPHLLKAGEIGAMEKEFLFEHFLASYSFHEAHDSEGFILDSSGEFLAVINIKDHIQMQLTDCKGELESTWNRLAQIEAELGKTVSFSFSSTFGFLTANPFECGTGLIAKTYLQIPAIIHTGQLEKILELHKDESIQTSGMLGNPHELLGDILMVSNQYSLGLTEENIISSLRNITTKLLVDEKSARTHLKQENSTLIKDKVARAFGLLIHSYQIETVEALGAISLIKLGLDLGWVTGTTNSCLNTLFFNCRRGHLSNLAETKQQTEELSKKRAELIHQTLKGLSLQI